MSEGRVQDVGASRALGGLWDDSGRSDSWLGRKPLSISFGNPSPLFALAVEFLAPVRVLRHLIWPLVLMAAYGTFFNWYEILSYGDRIAGTLEFWQNLLIGMFTANLLGKVAQGIAMGRNGVPCPEIGFKLGHGIIPRFYIDNAPIRLLGPEGQQDCAAAPLLFRLRMWAVGFLVWDMTRHSGSGLAGIAIVLSGVGLSSFIFTANPLWPADGYRWMASRLGRPKLRQEALRLLWLLVTLRGVPRSLPRSEMWLLLLYATASLVFTAFIVFSIIATIAYVLETQLRGTGVVIFCVMLAIFVTYLISTRQRRKNSSAQRAQARKAAAVASKNGPDRAGARTVRAARAFDGGTSLRSAAPSDRRRDMAGRRQRLRSADQAPAAGGSGQDGNGVDDLDRFLADDSIWEMPPADPSRPKGVVRDFPIGAAPDSGLDDILALPPTTAIGAEPGPDDLDDVLSALDVPDLADSASPPEDAARAQPIFSETWTEAPPSLPAGAPARPSRTSQPKADRAGMSDLDRLLQVGEARPTRASRWRALAVWAVLLGALLYVAFLPYAFEAGGEFVIQPLDRAEVRSRTDGEIVQIDVKEGDWVEKDSVMAVLSNWDEQRDVALHEADGAKLRAELATLTGGATPEQIAVAEQALRTAQLQVEAARQELDRQESLFASGTVAETVVLQARDAHAVALSNRDQAQASLDLVSAPTRDSEVDALRAAILRNDEELEFARLMLENSNIRAPVSGQVVSSLAEVPVGAYLPSGGLFAELEDNRTVIAEVEIPEITIHEVEIGAAAELRLWSDPETSLTGTVRSISPVAEERDFGNIIRVQVEVPNPEGRLAANMTGFGKVSAEERPVWQAFGRAIHRFFVIELWSWLP